MAQLMKGETFKDALKLVRGKPRFNYPIFVEVKADEIRCQVLYKVETHPLYGEVKSVEFLSYAGKPLHNMHWFGHDFIRYFANSEYTELDIGIEVNGNFNDSYRWTQSSSGTPQEKFDKKTGKTAPALYVGMVKIIVFDLPESPEKYMARRRAVINTADHLYRCGLNATYASGCIAETEDEVWEIYNTYREAGHEGAMGKTLDHLYERKRTFGWMKIKPSETFDGRITAINRATSITGEPLSRAGSISIELEDGSTADPAGIAHALGSDMFANPSDYIGRWVEFEAMERDRAGGYRHPRFIRVREDKQ